MVVHIGQVTSEVRSASPPASGGDAEQTEWDERERVESILARLTRDRLRTSTGSCDG